jgi:IS30 family transposase
LTIQPAAAGWGKAGGERRIGRWLPRRTDLGEPGEAGIKEIAMTITLTACKGLGYRSPVEAFLRSLAGMSKSASPEPLRFTVELTRLPPR